jgi:uncharacterized Zn-finger protein
MTFVKQTEVSFKSSHKRKNPTAAPSCTKAFAWSTNLQPHLTINLRGKSHSCIKCKKALTRLDILKLHMKRQPKKKEDQKLSIAVQFVKWCLRGDFYLV